MAKMVTMSLRFKEEQYEWMRLQAFNHRMSIAAFIRFLVDNDLKKDKNEEEHA